MSDMSQVIEPKSDQINADTLIAGPMTVTITGVDVRSGQEQPVAISLQGTDLVYRPGKSMCRVLVAAWGPDANAYVGRSLTLYRDPTVKWGGMEVGGIRISNMSHMEIPMTLALTATKGSRKPFVVKPLVLDKPATQTKAAPTVRRWIDGALTGLLDACQDVAQVEAIQGSKAFLSAWKAATDAEKDAIDALVLTASSRFAANDPLMEGEQEPPIENAPPAMLAGVE